MTEIQALQNAANNIECFVHQKHDTDKRKTLKKYFLTQNGVTVSPILDYNQLNHFILGWIKGTSKNQSHEQTEPNNATN